MSKKRSALLLLPLVLVAAAAGYMVSRQLAREAPALATGSTLPVPRPLPAFSLTDHAGQPFGRERLMGAPALMFFGFTHCPDVCPTTLALVAQLKRDPSMASLRPVFVTVDPGRDDTRAMGLYVNAFGGGMVGLRGETPELEPLLQAMSVAHAITPLPGGQYTVDHSAALYYINTRGEWSAAFTPPFTLDGLRQDLNALMASGY
jgi:protein SCO1/2